MTKRLGLNRREFLQRFGLAVAAIDIGICIWNANEG